MIYRAFSGMPSYSAGFSTMSFQQPSQQQRQRFAGNTLSSAGTALSLPESTDVFSTLYHCLHADTTLYHMADLTPKRLRKLGNIQGIIFDLDDTLMPLLSGNLSRETIHSLKRLKKAGFQMGIVSNNIQPAYCQMVRDKLAAEGLSMPFVEDARKPSSFGFEAMQGHFDLPPDQIVVVGDGLLSDIMGSKRLGMKAIRARWHTNHYYLKWEPFLSLWDSLTIAVNCIRVMLFTQRQPQLTGLHAIV